MVWKLTQYDINISMTLLLRSNVDSTRWTVVNADIILKMNKKHSNVPWNRRRTSCASVFLVFKNCPLFFSGSPSAHQIVALIKYLSFALCHWTTHCLPAKTFYVWVINCVQPAPESLASAITSHWNVSETKRFQRQAFFFFLYINFFTCTQKFEPACGMDSSQILTPLHFTLDFSLDFGNAPLVRNSLSFIWLHMGHNLNHRQRLAKWGMAESLWVSNRSAYSRLFWQWSLVTSFA